MQASEINPAKSRFGSHAEVIEGNHVKQERDEAAVLPQLPWLSDPLNRMQRFESDPISHLPFCADDLIEEAYLMQWSISCEVNSETIAAEKQWQILWTIRMTYLCLFFVSCKGMVLGLFEFLP